MKAEQLAAIRERAEAIDLGEPASLISTLAVDAHKDRAALLDHVARLQTALDEAHEVGLDILAHRDQLAARLEAVRALHPRGEFEDSPGDYYCKHCQETAGIWPCETIQALNGN